MGVSNIEIIADAVEVAAVDEADKIAALKEALLTVAEKADPADDKSETIHKSIASDLGQGFSAYPVDRNGNRVDWHDVKARLGGGVVHAQEYDKVTPDPTSTLETPKPPLKIEPRIAVMTAFCRGADRQKLEAAVAARVEAATVTATAKLEAVKAAPKEIDGDLELKPRLPKKLSP